MPKPADANLPVVCSARHCIRSMVKQCLESAMQEQVSVSCGRYDCFKLEDLHGQGKCAINISTPTQNSTAGSRTIGSGGRQFIDGQGDCGKSGCVGVDRMTLRLRLEVFAIDCDDALQQAEECAAWAASCICACQCEFLFSKIVYSGSDTRGTSRGDKTLVVVTDDYLITYDVNHCNGKIQRAKC